MNDRTWAYTVLETRTRERVTYAVHEVHFEDGHPVAWTRALSVIRPTPYFHHTFNGLPLHPVTYRITPNDTLEPIT